ncbi:MAG: hypothetical protein RLZ98_2230 [Pseudomonadota bacterium]|jgi:hypothetical protein
MSLNFKTLVAVTALAAAAALPVAAEGEPRYIEFSPRAVKGALYAPSGGVQPKVAIIAMHRTSNYMNHLVAKEMSKRGFLVLGMNPRSDNNEAAVNFDQNIQDLRKGVEFLKKQPGLAKVLLFGASGGGPTTTYYQAVQEVGLAYCKGANKLWECASEVAGGPKADGLILYDAHPGNPVNTLRSLNPSILDEADPTKVEPSLDPFNPANGFNPDGPSTYSGEFKARYFKAQSERMNRLIDKALKMRADMKAGRHATPDNDVFTFYRNRARLMELDMTVHPGTLKPRKLLKNDGSVDDSKPVMSVRQPNPANARRDKRFSSGVKALTVTAFLTANATRSANSDDGVDACSSNNSTHCAIQSITVPVLVIAMGGHYFIRDNEITFELAKSQDKDYVVVEGATHTGTPCAPCAKATGKDYSNATKNVFDYMAKWINARY